MSVENVKPSLHYQPPSDGGQAGRIPRKALWILGALISSMAVASLIVIGGCWLLRPPHPVLPEERAAWERAEGPGRSWVEGLGGNLEVGWSPMAGRVTGYRIDLSRTGVSDADLEHLTLFNGWIDELDLSHTDVDGSGMPRLEDLMRSSAGLSPTSVILSLRGTRVTDKTISRFVEGVAFTQLDLSNTRITDAGVKTLLEAKDIGRLHLSNTKVSRAGIRLLKGIQFLRWLALQGLALTDEDVPMLAELATKEWHLWCLDVSGTEISDKGINRLRQVVGRATGIVAAKRVIPIQDCPCPGQQQYRIVPYLAVAKALQEEGRDVGVAKLRGWTRVRTDCQVLILCRMLFEAKEGEEFRAPDLPMGRLRFLGRTSQEDWPAAPFALYQNVPILIAQGGEVRRTAGGSAGAWRIGDPMYLQYCVANCRWRRTRYRELGTAQIRQVVDDFIKNGWWKRQLSAPEKTFLRRQASRGTVGR